MKKQGNETMIEIKEVNDKDSLKAFVMFPFEL